MTHSDDDGLVLPPRLAPKHVVILPIYRSDDERSQVLPYCESLKQQLEAQDFADGKVKVQLDNRDLRGGEKNWQHIKRGVPLRAEVGPRDIAANKVFLARRDTADKQPIERDKFVAQVGDILDQMQNGLFQKALELQQSNTCTIDNLDEFKSYFTPADPEKPEIHGGFAHCHCSADDPAVEKMLSDLKVTIRCIPLNREPESGKCIFTGKPSTGRVVLGKAY
jgi:prolyl-tRNA synthetase